MSSSPTPGGHGFASLSSLSSKPQLGFEVLAVMRLVASLLGPRRAPSGQALVPKSVFHVLRQAELWIPSTSWQPAGPVEYS